MKIGILQTGLPPEELVEEFGDYPGFFERLLAGNGFRFQTWSVVEDVFPETPDAADGWLITGSRHGAYEDLGWIRTLEQLVRDIVEAERPLIGVCFGHQVIAQALGGTVEKFAGGWAVGQQNYAFGDETVTLNAWHQDQVTRVPDGANVVASNAFCENAALLYPGKAYSVQAHPEYGDDFIGGLIDHRGKGVIPDAQLAQASADLEKPVDNPRIAQQIARFFKERVVA